MNNDNIVIIDTLCPVGVSVREYQNEINSIVQQALTTGKEIHFVNTSTNYSNRIHVLVPEDILSNDVERNKN